MSNLTISTVEVPLELIRKSGGLAIDHGCSAFKAVYVDKDNFEELSKKNSTTAPISLMVVSGPQFSEGLDHLRTHAAINKRVTADEICTTGIGCAMNSKIIEEKLNVKISNLAEYDVMVKAFIYFTRNLSRSEIFHKPDLTRAPKPYILVDLARTLAEDPTTGLKGMDMGVLDNPKSVIETLDWDSKLPVTKAEPGYFPCLYVHIGSGLDFITVQSDGSYTLLDGSGRGGMSFLGLASLLTGTNSFEELLKMAEKGNPKNVDLYSDSFDPEPAEATAEGEGDMYSKTLASEASAIYCFGKCIGANLGDFKKEDLARSLLDHFVTDITQTLMTVCAAAGLKRACLGGSLVSTPLVRDLIVDWMDRRNVLYKITGKPTISLDFLKFSGHIGAIGALVVQSEKYSAHL